MDIDVSVSGSRKSFKSTLRYWWYQLNLKSVMQHLGLLVALMAYTVFGGLVSFKLIA